MTMAVRSLIRRERLDNACRSSWSTLLGRTQLIVGRYTLVTPSFKDFRVSGMSAEELWERARGEIDPPVTCSLVALSGPVQSPLRCPRPTRSDASSHHSSPAFKDYGGQLLELHSPLPHSGNSHCDIGVHAPVGGHCTSPAGHGRVGGGGLAQNEGPKAAANRLLQLACSPLREQARSSAFPSPVYSELMRPKSRTVRYVEIMGPDGDETPTVI